MPDVPPPTQPQQARKPSQRHITIPRKAANRIVTASIARHRLIAAEEPTPPVDKSEKPP